MAWSGRRRRGSWPLVNQQRRTGGGFGPIDEAFGWASVTKLLVSIASLVALEEGTVSLQDPVGPVGSTLAHVLSHASGLPFEGGTPIAPPATRRIYSNTGIELAAAHLETAAGMPFGEYLRAGVLEPLGMGQTVLNGSPAHGAKGPVADLLALAGELSAPSLVSAKTLRALPLRWRGRDWPASCRVSGVSTRATGASARKFGTRKPLIGPAGPTLLKLSAILASPAPSCGSTRWRTSPWPL